MKQQRNVLEWDRHQVAGLLELGLMKIWTELDSNHRVSREIGFNASGEPGYFADAREHAAGLFDGQEVSCDLAMAHQSEERLALSRRFEQFWTEHELTQSTGPGNTTPSTSTPAASSVPISPPTAPTPPQTK